MSQHYIGAEHFRNIGTINHFMAYLVGSFGHPGRDLKEIELNSVLGIFRARFRMQLYRAGYLKYDDSGHNFFAVEDRFQVDIEQIREGLTVFGVAPWENGLPEPEYVDGPFFDEDQTGMWGWDI